MRWTISHLGVIKTFKNVAKQVCYHYTIDLDNPRPGWNVVLPALPWHIFIRTKIIIFDLATNYLRTYLAPPPALRYVTWASPFMLSDWYQIPVISNTMYIDISKHEQWQQLLLTIQCMMQIKGAQIDSCMPPSLWGDHEQARIEPPIDRDSYVLDIWLLQQVVGLR